MLPAGQTILQRFIQLILDPAVKVIFTAGLFLFFWGIIEFLWELKDGKAGEAGKQHMLWGMVGMLIMVSFGAIIQLIMNTFGIDVGTATDVSRLNNASGGFFGTNNNGAGGGVQPLW